MEDNRHQNAEYQADCRQRQQDLIKNPNEENELPHEQMERRSVESIVIIPSASISRKNRIAELEKRSKSDDKTRNRRFFNSFLGIVGSRPTDARITKQAEKVKEVEEKLAYIREKEIEEAREKAEKRAREVEAAREEMAILIRKKALLQYASQQLEHYELLKKSIQTKTKPVIFFMPAKHNVRSLELHKISEANIDRLIEMRKASLKEELEKPEPMHKPRESRVKGMVHI